MSVNLATKYEKAIATKFTRESYVAGNTSGEFTFTGARSVCIYTPQTVGLNDYVREGGNRFGAPVEMQDTVQELTLSQDKGFAITIDKGNNVDQMTSKGAAKMLTLQLKEQVVPFMDKYALNKWAREAGTAAGLANAPTRDTIVEAIFDGAKALDSLMAPDDNRILYLPTTYYNMLRLSREYLAVDSFDLSAKALVKGLVGSVADMKVVKVPDVMMPEDAYFLITYKGSVIHPNKLKTARVLTDVAGIDGAVLEGRNYFDAFVLEAKCGGVYTAVPAAKTMAAPVISMSGGKATVTAEAGASVYYTLEGGDPRYNKSRELYTAAVTVPAGQTIRACAVKEGKFNSPVAEKKNG